MAVGAYGHLSSVDVIDLEGTTVCQIPDLPEYVELPCYGQIGPVFGFLWGLSRSQVSEQDPLQLEFSVAQLLYVYSTLSLVGTLFFKLCINLEQRNVALIKICNTLVKNVL